MAEPSAAGAADAQSAGADAIVPSIDALPEVHAFVVAVPTFLHGEVVLRLVARGVPVFCEKPLTDDVSAARRIVAAAGDRVFVMDKWRYHAGVHVLRDLAYRRELGPVLGVKTTRVQWGSHHEDVDCSWILLPHELTIALEILGFVPEPVCAVAESDGSGLLGLSAFLDGPAWLQCEVGVRSPRIQRVIELRCRDGVAVLGGPYARHIDVLRSSGGARRAAPRAWEQIPFVAGMPLLAELTEIVAYVAGTGPAPRSSAAEGLRVVETITRLRRLAGVADTH